MENNEENSPQPGDIQAILFAVEDERKRQDHQWGGPEHDDQHDRDDWVYMDWGIPRFTGRAVQAAIRSELSYSEKSRLENIREYEEALISIAALAVAAVQSSRRKRNG